MTPHGPDAETFLKASAAPLVPDRFDGGLAFMFETSLMLKVTPWALGAPHRDVAYQSCWQQLPRVFDPSVREMTALSVKPHAAVGDAVASDATAGGAASGAASEAFADGGVESESHKRRREVGPASAGGGK